MSKLVAIVWQMFDTPPKETPTQVFSCDICVIFKKTFIYRTSSVAASVQRQLKKKRKKAHENYAHQWLYFLLCLKSCCNCSRFKKDLNKVKQEQYLPKISNTLKSIVQIWLSLDSGEAENIYM